MAVAVVASMSIGPGVGPTPAIAASGTSAHPYSDPVWYPLRNSELRDWVAKPANGGPWSALVSCVRTNCAHKPNSPHGYWAIDLVGDRGDPIHAAGAGVFHIGSLDTGCRSTPEESAGTWVWIDHGGGVVSRYHHLDQVLATEDQLVTPADQIGMVGSTGDICGQEVNYLHFEVRTGGVSGTRVDPGQLTACDPSTGNRLSLPAAVGYASWDDVPHRQVGLPRTASQCIPAVPATPDRPTSTLGTYGNQTATISWSAPSRPVDGVVVSVQIFRPSFDGFSRPTFVRLPADTRSHTFTGLINGRPYRYRVLYHNSEGNGGLGPEADVVPGAPPTQPTVRRLVATDERIGYGWYQSEPNGRPVTRYQVAIRRQTGSGYTSWSMTDIPLENGTTHNWFDLAASTTYQVRVRGDSAAGPSAWSPTSTVTTKAS